MRFLVTTAAEIDAPRERIFRLLHDAQLPLAPPAWVGLVGAPAPRACRLVSEPGVGAHRQCVTAKGPIDQRVTEWAPGRVLAFEMVAESAGLRFWVARMADRFDLEPLPSGKVRLTRTSDIETRGWFGALKALLLRPVVRRIHRYVFRNFAVMADGPRAEALTPA
jgi:Polyketide cyclase / dehydrase and lipid transport